MGPIFKGQKCGMRTGVAVSQACPVDYKNIVSDLFPIKRFASITLEESIGLLDI
jgi:hypothetical protein